MYTHEVPQRAERGNTHLLAALHDLRITVVVRVDEDNCQGQVSAASTTHIRVTQHNLQPSSSYTPFSRSSSYLACCPRALNPTINSALAQCDGG